MRRAGLTWTSSAPSHGAPRTAHLAAFYTLLFILAALVGAHGFDRGFNWPPVRSDGEGYYAYLPVVIVHRTTDLAAVGPHFGGTIPRWTGIIRNEDTGRFSDIYPVGVALLLLPFFLVAHAAVAITGSFSPDGYSLPYQVAVLVAAIAYLGIGLWALAQYLARFFSSSSVLVALIAIVFGTSLFHYGTYDAIWPHVYTFCFLSLLLSLTPRFWASERAGAAVAVGAVLGVLFLIRNYNLLYVVLFLAYPAGLEGGLSEHFARRWRALVLAGSVAFVVVTPQFLLWKSHTGHFITYSYAGTGLRFAFGAPHLTDVLFSFEKGVFIWAPVLLPAGAGLLWAAARPCARELAVAARLALVSIACVAYLIASWSMWSFGGGFGHRGFVDTYPLFSVGMAAIFDWTRRPVARFGVLSAAFMGVVISTIQMINYWIGKVPFAEVTREQYVAGLVSFPERALVALTPGTVSSRNAGVLRGSLSVEAPPDAAAVSAEAPLSLRLIATNTGAGYWLDAAPRHIGRVGVSTRWYRAEDLQGCRRPSTPAVLDGQVMLPNLVRPSESIEIRATIRTPAQPGHYVLLLELEGENVTWFADADGGQVVCRRIHVR